MSITDRHIAVDRGTVHVREAGSPGDPTVLLLHGWPQDATCWNGVLDDLGHDHHALAADLPGIGGSTFDEPRGEKVWLARAVHELVVGLGLRDVTLVGQDAGGMTAFAYIREFGAELHAAAIMNTAVPGIAPWDDVLANPYVWHFAFHSIPGLPETLVHHETRAYFDFFFDVMKGEVGEVSAEARERYVDSYRSPAALRQGFEFYRAMRQDAEDNRADVPGVDLPVRYVRGTAERVDIDTYIAGFTAAGLTNVTPAWVEGAGHYAADENPSGVAAVIRELVRDA